jgi:hypothetical protein
LSAPAESLALILVSTLTLPARRRTSVMLAMPTSAMVVSATLDTASLYLSCRVVLKAGLVYGIVTVIVTKNWSSCWEEDGIEGEQVELPAGASESDGQSVHVVAPTADEYLLMSHAVHVSDPAAAENLPKPQSLQTETPEDAPYFPATHKVHTAEEVADEAAENFPALHDTQVTADEDAEYLPTSQSTQCASPLVSEYLPATQLVQESGPIESLCFPATQLVHGPPFGPVKPALHEQ